MAKRTEFQEIRDDRKRRNERNIPEYAGKSLQQILRRVALDLDDAEYTELIAAIVRLSDDPQGQPLEITHTDSLMIRDLLVTGQAGVDARDRAINAYHEAESKGLRNEDRVHKYAYEFGFDFTDDIGDKNERKAYARIFSYAEFLNDDAADPDNPTVPEKERAIDHIKAEFGHKTDAGAISALWRNRKHPWVVRHWSGRLPALHAIPIPRL